MDSFPSMSSNPFVPDNWKVVTVASDPHWPFPDEADTVTVKMEKVTDYKEHGIKITHVFTEWDNREGGVCIAWRKTQPHFRQGKMVEVALAYCHPGEAYNRKQGVKIAVDRFLAGNTVTVPCGGPNNSLTEQKLIQMFWWSVNS